MCEKIEYGYIPEIWSEKAVEILTEKSPSIFYHMIMTERLVHKTIFTNRFVKWLRSLVCLFKGHKYYRLQVPANNSTHICERCYKSKEKDNE